MFCSALVFVINDGKMLNLGFTGIIFLLQKGMGMPVYF